MLQLSLESDRRLGEVGVGDDAAELALGFEHPGGGGRRHVSPDCRRLTLRLVRRKHEPQVMV
jgi:hypothetical protein